MALVRSKDTKPEMVVRRLTHGMGFRYRLHDSKLPGKPDLVFKARKKAMFVHGCFWHRHDGACKLTRTPKSNLDFWESKFAENVKRDEARLTALADLGYQVLVLWECELKDEAALADKIRQFLEN